MSEIDIVGLAVDGLKRSIAADEAADTIATLTAERDDARAIVAKQAAEVGIWRDKEDNPDRFVTYVELAEERIGFLKARAARLEKALREARHWIVASGAPNPSTIINAWIDPALSRDPAEEMK